jgi:hypothetical protein
MSSQGFGPGSPKSFRYPRADYDLESGIPRKPRKPKNSHLDAPAPLSSALMKIRYFYEAHPVAVALILLSFGLSVLILLSVYETRFRTMRAGGGEVGAYPFPALRNLVMVAGHSVYTSASCGKLDREDSWFLEPYQRHPGQAATFLAHVHEIHSPGDLHCRGLLCWSSPITLFCQNGLVLQTAIRNLLDVIDACAHQ